jgi:site-specific DNA-methyltransferase (cytosine-N4-specific)
MAPFYTDDQVTLHCGDALAVLRTLPDSSADCVVTSPPYYGLRDYGESGQYGLEPTPAAYVETMRAVFTEVRRVLAPDGTLWLNLGDSYANGSVGRNDAGRDIGGRGGNRLGSGNPGGGRTLSRGAALPPKNLLGIPWRVAFALQDDGWILRNAIIWDKPNAMPESVTDRCSSTYEYVFLFAHAHSYWFDLDSIREQRAAATEDRYRYAFRVDGNPAGKSGHLKDGGFMDGINPAGRNPGDVWTLPTQPFPEAHFAVMPPSIASRCVLAGCKRGGIVLDPFCGSGTTGMVALRHGRRFVGIDLSAEYLRLALRTRLAQGALLDEPAWGGHGQPPPQQK